MNQKVGRTAISQQQAKFFAYELTRRFPSGSPERFNATLLDAQVDLNPHQVESALFAFRSPLSKGAILADEVGLGKTIEAGILLSQLSAEKRRKLLIICPANLRKQWSQELSDKFFLDSLILENKNFKQFQKGSKKNPFEQAKIVICSYQFATAKADLMQLISWDLVIIDEAHRLRNVYKPKNKIGNAIKEALSHSRKILLTATPLQNSLLELYGLVSIIDEHTFGDIKSFRGQFLKTVEGENYQDLRDRLKTVCIRNLRRQVQEYIRYTNRIPLTIKFEPTDEEHKLYGLVSDYLQQELLYALPTSQRHLMTLILRKLLASSSFAIAGTLTSLINKLNEIVADQERKSVTDDISDDFELADEYAEEYEEEETEESSNLTLAEIEEIKQEITQLTGFKELAESIMYNAKGEKLLTALKQGFANLQQGAAKKVIIFTESTRTQTYLFKLLETDYQGKVVLFNGSNNDERSNKIYKSWIAKHKGSDKVSGSPTADKRAAIVDFFREEATVMIATEAAAEGINLQFCSMIINYDLPWNPQRIEQRIGRCHRYGQKFDVVVVNFLNVKNAADIRVFQLLDEKFKLFSGVFGASDDVLGSIESGVDFEKRIIEIYQKCRSEEDIKNQFDLLQKELEEQIGQRMQNTRQQLLENFDDEVIEKLRIRMTESQEYINKFEDLLWTITKHKIQGDADFNDSALSFKLNKQPFPNVKFLLGTYKLGKNVEDAHTYRIGHPLAQNIIEDAKSNVLDHAKLVFDLSGYSGNISILNDLKNKEGWISVTALCVSSFEDSDYLICLGATNESETLSEEQVKRLLSLPVKSETRADGIGHEPIINRREEEAIHLQITSVKERDNDYFKAETEKLNKWADDRVNAAELAIKETKRRIKELNREALKTTDSQEQLKIQNELQDLSKKQKKQRQEIFNVEDEIAEMRDSMISNIEKRMRQELKQKRLFTIQWQLI